MDPVRIMVLTDDQTRQQRWREILAQSDRHFLVTDDRDSGHVDLVISDRALADDSLVTLFHQVRRDEIGLISVGSFMSADVQLPGDCGDRELRLSCELLAEVIELRRERNALKQREQILSRLAFSDPLTELPNRRAWDREAARRFKAAEYCHQPICFAILDLDNFKQLNDRLGHQAGDEVLRNAGRTLAEHSVPEQDYVARLGGDEFGYVISGLPSETAAEHIEKARAALAYQLGDQEAACCNASAGMACASSSPGKDWQHLLAAADKALRQAKSCGRNQLMLAKVD